jgi:pyruvate kinase
MTKVVCTIGPSTDTAAPIQELVNNGMNVARLNFSHAGTDYSYPEACLALIRNAHGRHAELSAGATFRMPNNLRAVLVDTKGPEIRTGRFVSIFLLPSLIGAILTLFLII